VTEDLSVTKAKWQRWVGELSTDEDSVVRKLELAIGDCARIIGMQTASKWGTEKGPDTFRKTYTGYWEQEKAALIAMKGNVESFVDAIMQALQSLDDGEENAAAALNAAASNIPSMYMSEEKRRLLESEFGPLPIPPGLFY